MRHYNAVMTRAAQANQQQAVNVAMRTRDYATGGQSVRSMEDTLAAIEDFLAKSSETVEITA